MISKILMVALLVSVVSCFTEDDYKIAFSEWQQEHQKSYTSEDFQYRYLSFKENMDKVEKCNKNPNFTFTCGLNKFSDLPFEEFSKLYLMTPLKDVVLEQRPFVALEPLVNASSTGDAINWAAKGAVTPPKDQGGCGSCWSFSVSGSIEALNQIYTGKLNSLSEQNLVDCAGKSYGCYGCGGGDPRGAMNYVIANHGIELENNYPYTGAQGSCHFNSQYTGASMGSVQSLNSGDENDLTNHINSQPVSVLIDATDNLQAYKAGLFNDNSCSNAIDKLDHAVLAIGYGNGYAGSNQDYYIVKNSWGLGWGVGGYVYFARNAGNMCGIATYASCPRP